MKFLKKILIITMVIALCTGCGRYSFFNEIKGSVEEQTGEDYSDRQAEDQMERYNKYERPLAFSDEALQGFVNLVPLKEGEYKVEDNYNSMDTYTAEIPANPYEVTSADPDRYIDTAEDLLQSYFNFFMYEAGGFKNAPEDKKIEYIKVRHSKVIAGNIEEFAIESLVDIHVPNGNDSIYAQYGITGNDNAIHCALTIHAKHVSDYTFQLIGLVQAEEVRKVIKTDINFIKPDPLKYNANRYRIQDEQLAVSYNSGEAWVDVPLSINELFNRGDGNGAKPSSQLESGSYYITPKLTAFVYGGSMDMPVTMIISKDSGETWNKVKVSNEMNTRRNFISFSGDYIYVLSCGDRTMSQELSHMYVSRDDGVSWSDSILFPEGSSLVTGFTFINNNVGFITFRNSQWPDVFRTENGGTTWNSVEVPLNEESYTLAYSPEMTDKGLQIFVGQYEYGEMEGIMGKFISDDDGKTWSNEGWVIR